MMVKPTTWYDSNTVQSRDVSLCEESRQDLINIDEDI